VTLTGPFTVTDDKLGSFACGSSTTILASGASVTCTKNYTILASDLGNVTLPTGRIANINTGFWLQGVVSAASQQMINEANTQARDGVGDIRRRGRAVGSGGGDRQTDQIRTISDCRWQIELRSRGCLPQGASNLAN
jgi:hypothetical protein